MANNFEIVGVEAIVAGIAAFERDANNVNKLIAQMQKATGDLASGSAISWGAVENAGTTALTAIVTGVSVAAGALAAATGTIAKFGATFDQSVLRSSAVLGATATQTEQLGGAILLASSNSRIGISQIADAQNALARSGLTLTQIENGALDATVKFAEASGGQLGVSEAARLVSEAMLAWGLSASQATSVTTALTVVANSSSISFGDLFSIMRQTVPIAVSLGYSVQDLATAIGIMGQAGISGTISGSALKDVLVKLSDPTKNALAFMDKYKVSLLDAQKNIVPLREVIDRLNKAFGDQAVAAGKVTVEQRNQALAVLFGTRGIEAGLALVRGGTEAYDKFAASIKGTNIDQLASKMRDSLIPQLDVFRNQIEGFIIQMSGPLTRALTDGAESINSFLRALNPNIFTAFGDALLTIFSGQNIGRVKTELEAALGPGLASTIGGAIDIVLALRAAVLNELVPAFVIFFQSVFGGVSAVQNFGGFLESVASSIGTIAAQTARAIVVFGTFVAQLRQAAATSDLMSTALRALTLLPVAGLALIFAELALNIGLSLVPILALSAAIVLVQEHGAQVRATVVDAFNKVSQAVQQALDVVRQFIPVIAAVGAYLGVVFAGIALDAIGAYISALTTARAVWIAFVVVQQALNLGAFVAQLALASAQLVYMSAVAVTGALIALDAFILRMALMAAAAVVQTTQVSAAFITQTAIIIASATAGGTAMVASFARAVAASIAWDTALAVAAGAAVAFEGVVFAVGLALGSVEATAVVAAAGFALLTAAITVAVPLLGSVVTLFTVGMVPAIRTAATAIISLTTTAISALLSALPALGAAFLAAADDALFFARVGIQAAIGALVDLATTAIPIAIGAIGAAIAAIAPFLLGMATIAAVVGVAYLAFQNNFLGIRDVAEQVVTFVVGKLNEFLAKIEEIPFVSNLINIASDTFAQLGATVQNARDVAVPAIDGIIFKAKQMIDLILNGFPAVDAQVAATANNFVHAFGPMGEAAAYLNDQLEKFKENTGAVDVTPVVPSIPEFTGGFGLPSLVGPGPGPGPGPSKADQMKELVKQFQSLLSILPGDTQALAQFLAQLETDTPGRLKPMVAALLASKGLLDQIAASNQRILVLNQAIAGVQQNITQLQAQQNVLDLQAEQATLGQQAQITQLAGERLQIEQKLLPITQQIADLDARITRLQQTDYDLEGRRLSLQVQMIPIQQQIADIDTQISAARQENFANTLASAQVEQQQLPIKQQIAALETQINRVVDQRNTLLQRQAEILAQQSVDNLNRQLTSTQTKLDSAWQALNVPQILALQAQKEQLTSSISTAQDQLTAIQEQQTITSQNDELIQIGLKLQEVALQDLLVPLDDQLTALQNQRDLYDANTAVIVAQLDLQKAALIATLDPLQAQLTLLDNIKAVNDANNAIAINGLNEQKAALEALAAPLEDDIRHLNDESAVLQNQIDIVKNLAEQQKAQLNAQLINDQLELASLTTIRNDEQARFDALVLSFTQALTASQAFTLGESLEVAKRLGFWDDQISKLGDMAVAFGSVSKAADALSTAIANIPRDVTVTVHIRQEGTIPSFAQGGVVPGPTGKAMLVIAHGGEKFLGVGSNAPTFTQGSVASSQNGGQTNVTYQVNATYQQPQPVGSVALDMRALVQMTKY